MQARGSKVRSINAVNCWTLAEATESRAKKIEKKIIKRHRRALEKKVAKEEIKDALRGEEQ
ncbi:hypothetical protein FTE28_05155 [Bacillus licheniformis]|uniref:hypothetical protein n=1 Tax=Bacillus licheniformis TaxID=1402 RepID=UPI000949B091|nr:hypothetical protein [Bacillus licheniformis]ARC58838.1 hypothetical protein BaDB11_00169 [Bacillus licheniformis]AYC51925.1 hypothetical protein C7M53_11720 [Bacillus licheniformis]MCU9959195.1 hypothetical protein [Bacillus licheniformis]MEC2103652.1 hypothetical protein [Bacillus licheniformis]OLQ51280.1 hypothetical protein BHT96_21540 [Bacillus licheniformis]